MGRLISVKFRGEERDVVVDHDTGYDHSTNTHDIDWHFVGVGPDAHEALKITDEEEQSIFDQLLEATR